MKTKRILGLDLGTNSIGWALIENNFKEKTGKIINLGSRIIPMTQDDIGNFNEGNTVSNTAERTRLRGVRRLRERHLLRRYRLHQVLNILDFLPEHYAKDIDFEKKKGQFFPNTEPKLAYNKNEFIFKDSFNEMLNDFKKTQPELVKNGKLVPYDWTIYYLRKKALTEKITKEEIAWIILNFNQKRGYYQLRGEEEEVDDSKLVEYHSLKVVDIIPDEEGDKEKWYSVVLENGWVYRRRSKDPLDDWMDKIRDFIVTTELNEDGSIKLTKDGEERRSFRAPKEDDWGLVKTKTQHEIDQSEKTVGAYIYDRLLKKPKQKIRGKLIQTIERKYYKEELQSILRKQIELQPELFTEESYVASIRELYNNNKAHRIELSNKGFVHLFLEDIIFYQRPLRSQKSLIGNCKLEYKIYRSKTEDDKVIEKRAYLKAIPKSHPLFQEFRLWQWIYNLRIYLNEDDTNITSEFLNNLESWEDLFEYLNTKSEINQKDLITFLLERKGLSAKEVKNDVKKYRWNFVEDKSYPCNETKASIQYRLSKVDDVEKDFLTNEIEVQLWHIIYSVTDIIEYKKALKSFARKHNLNETSFLDNFLNFPPIKSEFGTYSQKAIKKLLPLIRLGKKWSWDNIHDDTKSRIHKIINGEYDENIKERVREKSLHLKNEEDFQGLDLWLAQYIVYDRHSESELSEKWETVDALKDYLKDFKQHSLRNPIVEQVVTETLRVVGDIWTIYGNGEKDYFDEIHVELGRDLKSSADQRKHLSQVISQNENTNNRIKHLLLELKNDKNIENVRPYSPMQAEALRIYEEGVISALDIIPDDIEKIIKSSAPTSSELNRYKLWLEQGYISPYTGQVIPLSKLFTSAYEIEHIIPQSRYFDNSFNNKIICESAVNKLKDNQLGLEFIKNHGGEIVEIGYGKSVRILNEEQYQLFVKEKYSSVRNKRNILLMDEIPEEMITRQLNDTRYISKFISNLLSNIVRSKENDDGINSKNLLQGNGKITNRLKHDWGLNDVWNDLILPRFKRMNEISNSTDYTSWNDRHQKFLPTVPLELSKGFQKKRIDHRHHALDALVIACTSREHVNLLNNQHAKSSKRHDLNRILRHYEQRTYYNKNNEKITRDVPTLFLKPWDNFTIESKKAIENVIVSFKQSLRVINKTTNNYQKFVEDKGRLVKKYVKQTKGDSWAIRKPLHKDTVYGEIKLRKKKEVRLSIALDNYDDIVDKLLRQHILSLVALNYDKKLLTKYFKDRNNTWNDIDISRVEVYYWDDKQVATREFLDTSFTEKKIVGKITDTGIQKILLAHLDNYKELSNESPEKLAFTPEGIEEMNKNIVQLNNGKFHQPIYKVRVYETKGSKFNVGYVGNKSSKFVEAAKGTNLFFAIYEKESGERNYATIPLNIVVERLKQKLTPVPEYNDKNERLLFYLSPDDLVYVPLPEEENLELIDFSNLTIEQKERVYKMVSATGKECHFIPINYASLIKVYDAKSKIGELASLNKSELTICGEIRIKNTCVKLKSNRLGQVDRV